MKCGTDHQFIPLIAYLIQIHKISVSYVLYLRMVSSCAFSVLLSSYCYSVEIKRVKIVLNNSIQVNHSMRLRQELYTFSARFIVNSVNMYAWYLNCCPLFSCCHVSAQHFEDFVSIKPVNT